MFLLVKVYPNLNLYDKRMDFLQHQANDKKFIQLKNIYNFRLDIARVEAQIKHAKLPMSLMWSMLISSRLQD